MRLRAFKHLYATGKKLNKWKNKKVITTEMYIWMIDLI